MTKVTANMDMANLTPLQREIVTSNHKHICVLAGPGTGKTRVLTSRILFQLNNSQLNKKIIAITFTNKAADEIYERINATLKNSNNISNRIFIGTIHSFCYSKLDKKFTIIDEEEYIFLLKEFSKTNNIKISQNIINKFKAIQNYQLEELDNDLLSLYNSFKHFLKESKLINYDDLIQEMIENIDYYDEEFEEILIDEFQDLNNNQYRLILKLLNKTNRLFVIGDPNQSIYKFRGSVPEIFKKLQEDIKDIKIYYLNESFRNPSNFISLSQKVIKRQSNSCYTKSSLKHEGKIIYKTFDSDVDEAKWILKKIKELTGNQDLGLILSYNKTKTYEYNQIAILYRINSISSTIYHTLKKNNIPVKTTNEGSFTKDLLKFLQICLKLKDNPSSNHLSSLAREYDKRLNLDLFEFFLSTNLNTDLLFEKIKEKLIETNDFISRFAIERIIKERDKINQINLIFKDEIDLLDAEKTGVNLLTLHSSKGLEFPVVFIIGLEQGIIPLDDEDLSEEERILYVGLTRASEILFLSSSKKRESIKNPLKPSHFIDILELTPQSEEKTTRKKNIQQKLFK